MTTLSVNPVRLNLYRSDISIPSPVPSYYIFGEYDYLAIEQPKNFDAEPSAEAVVLATLYPSEVSNDTRKISEWCAGGITQGLLVRLDLGVSGSPSQSRNWVEDLCHCAEAVYSGVGKNALCLLSIGSFSVYVLVDLENADLIEEMRKLAAIQLAPGTIVARTTTMPFVSSAIASKTAGLDPKQQQSSLVKCQIGISCPFFTQRDVLAYVNSRYTDAGVTIAETLGDYDVAVYFKHKLPLAQIAQETYELRKQFPSARTFTHIGAEIASNVVTEYELAPPIQFNLERRARGRSARLLDKIDWITRRLNASQKDKIGELAQADLIPVVEHIVQELDAGPRNLEDGLGNDLLDAVVEAYMQRGGHRSLPSKDHELALTNLALGAFIPFKALHHFATTIYEHIVSLMDDRFISEKNIERNWNGLIVASNSHGFEIYPLLIIQVPYDALLLPCQSDLTWQVLSHEICHVAAGWFVESPEMRRAIESHLDCFSENDPTKIPKEVYYTTLKGDFSEVAAHYLDYLMFYGRDLEKYLQAIWATWPKFASLGSNEISKNTHFRHYLLRSFSIFATHHKLVESLASLDFSKPSVWLKSSDEMLAGPLKDFVATMNRCLKDDSEGEAIRRLIEGDPGQALPRQLARLAPLIQRFTSEVAKSLKPEAESRLDGLAGPSPEREAALKELVSGRVVFNPITMPHLLVRDYHLRLTDPRGNSRTNIAEQLALLLTFAGGI